MSFLEARNHAEVRQRAEKALQHMNGPDLMRTAVTADFTSECLKWLRDHFDIDDPDAAMVWGSLQQFKARMTSLFVDGNILADASKLPGAGHSGKTACQMVFEEIEKPEPMLACSLFFPPIHHLTMGLVASDLGCLPTFQQRIFYGNRVHHLCSTASAQEIRGIMEEMAQVVFAMLGRLEADLCTDEFAVSLRAFDLAAWADVNNHTHLRSHFGKLCKLLGKSPQNTVPSLAGAAKALAPVIRAAKNQGLDASNRVAWSWLLSSTWRSKYAAKAQWGSDCNFIVAFYVSVKLNTTTLERDLGKLLQQLEAHSGPIDATGSFIGSLMEVAVEGPKTEAELFVPGQPQRPTDFARLCSQLYLQHYGRRFKYHYAKATKVHGPRSKQLTGHKPGTLANAVKGRHETASKIVLAIGKTAALPSFVPGIQLPLKPAGEQGEGDGTESHFSNFLKHTERKRQSALVSKSLLCCLPQRVLLEFDLIAL